MDWQPIETAPKDAGNILLAVRVGKLRKVTIGWWGSGYYDRATKSYRGGWGDAHSRDLIATHWMPLPPPPEPA